MGRRGRLITIEGIDGAGKSTLAAGLLAQFPQLQLMREPGGVAAAERLRELVKDPALELGDRAEALIFAAARAQLVDEALGPALEAGTDVLLDRFTDSSLAYQGGGRELGVDAVAAISRFATGGIVPDATLYLRIELERAAERREGSDRLELAGEDFFARIADTYDMLAERSPERITTIDASGTPEQVLGAAVRTVKTVLSGG